MHRLLLRGRRIAVRSKHGIVWRLDPFEYVDSFVLRHGFYEEEVLETALSSLRSGEVFWDIGSNLGLHALTVKHRRPDITVFAFEPNPSLAHLVQEVARQNDLDINQCEIALDAVAGQQKFFIHEGNAGRCGLHNWNSDPDLKYIEVVTDTADNLLANKRGLRPNVIKMDVEGNEQRVLDGMADLLKSRELHTIIFEDSVDDNSTVKRTLRSAGFRCEQLVRKESTQHNLENYVGTRDRNSVRLPDENTL